MRKMAFIVILTLLWVTPVLAAEQKASGDQAKKWNQTVLESLEAKYGGDDAYSNDYVTLGEWTVIDVDSAKQKQEAQEQIAKMEEELAPIKSEAVELQNKLNYFKTLLAEVKDEAYKKEIEKIVKDTEKALKDKQGEVDSKEKERADLEEKAYPEQIAVGFADIHFGGKTLGTMTYHEKFFIDAKTGELMDPSEAQGYDEVAQFLNKQPQVEQSKFRHETLGLFFLALGVGGWFFVTRKF